MSFFSLKSYEMQIMTLWNKAADRGGFAWQLWSYINGLRKANKKRSWNIVSLFIVCSESGKQFLSIYLSKQLKYLSGIMLDHRQYISLKRQMQALSTVTVVSFPMPKKLIQQVSSKVTKCVILLSYFLFVYMQN